MKNRKKKVLFFDYSLLFVVLVLIIFGLVMIYSTSSYEANLEYKDAAYYLKKQLFATVFGIVVMVLLARIDYRFWEKFAIWGIIISAILIVLVKSPLGRTVNGASRWIYIGSLSIQPAEVAKIAVILFMASILSRIGKKGIQKFKGIMTVLILPIIIAGMVYVLTQNLSSAIIIGGIAIVMWFVASPDYKKFVILLTLVVIVAAVGIYLAHSDILGFRGERIKAWIDPEAYASGTGFQTLQALYAIGSGGLFGKGIGQSLQKLGFIPEAQNDMIFSIICEELGLAGAIAVLVLFIILIWRCMVIANNAQDLFGALLVTGVMAHFAIQVILNVAVVTNTIPNTGITLPFISYGGTSMLFLLAEIGLVLSVGRGISFEEPNE